MISSNILSNPILNDTIYDNPNWNAVQLEKEILFLDAMELGTDVKVYDVKVSEDGQHIHTIESGWENKQTIVLIHGFGASAIYYSSLISKLRKFYHVYAIGMKGFGLLSRPEFNPEKFEEAIDFIIDSLEVWRKVLKLSDFSILAHSYGAYVTIQYLLKFKIKIEKLFLLSPAGMTEFPTKKFKKQEKRLHCCSWLTDCLTGQLWNAMRSLKYSAVPFMNLIGKKNYIKSVFRGKTIDFESKDQRECTALFYDKTSSLSICGDKSLYMTLDAGSYSKRSGLKSLLKLKESGYELPKMIIMYGRFDWMDRVHTIYQSKKQKLDIPFEIIERAEHMNYKNREAIVYIIMGELQGDFIQPKERSLTSMSTFSIGMAEQSYRNTGILY